MTLYQKPFLHLFKNKKKRTLFWFTLVELIVVIVILAILATIAFLSFNSQSSAARNSTRMADINNVTKSLELYFIKVWSYPVPDNNITITYLGWDLWYQWNIWDSFTKRLQYLSKKVVDPLDNREYWYSKIAYGNVYQLSAKFEWDVSSVFNDNNNLEPQNTYATTWSTNMTAYIKWNYYSSVVKTITWWLVYLVATPSIISTVTSNSEITSNALSWKLLLNWRTTTTELVFNPKLVFSWATLPKDNTWSWITNMMANIASVYTWTEVVTMLPAIKEIVNAPTEQLATLWSIMISTQLWSIATAPVIVSGGWSWVSNSCATNPSFSNLWTLTIWTPTSVWQVWTYSTTPGNCTYSCTNGYSGNNCSTLPSWTVAWGWDCLWVSNSLWANLATWSCIDNRTYVFQDWATSDKTYMLLKIDGKWFFNENLAYTPTTWYKWSGSVWSTSDSWYYSCPWINLTYTSDCSQVANKWFRYQWSAAMAWATSTFSTWSRVQWICPDWWAIPTQADVSWWSYFPPTDWVRWGSIPWWFIKGLWWARQSDWTFKFNWTNEWYWLSWENSTTTAWYIDTSNTLSTLLRWSGWDKARWFAIRCIKK